MADKSNEWKEQRPYRDAASITPNDSADLPDLSRGIFVGTGGALTVRLLDASADVVFANIPNGTLLPISVRRVMVTGTTASGLIALY